MSTSQANDFTAHWTAVTQYTDASGLSATVFQNIADGKRYLAIRGTESSGDFNADYILALGFPSFLSPQFIQLRTQVQAWLDNGTLTNGFSVAGHSLGGYLSAAIGSWFHARVGEVYTFNAPGLGGPTGNALELFRTTFGLDATALISGIHNIRGTAGVSLISGLGVQLAPPVLIETEASLNPIDNHSIVGLTDALALANLFSQLALDLKPAQINGLIQSASNQQVDSLEKTLDQIRAVFLGEDTLSINTTPTADREAFYSNLTGLMSNPRFAAAANRLGSIVNLANLDDDALANKAKGDFGYLFALETAAPFALLNANTVFSQSSSGLFARWQQDQSLSAADRAAGKANFSDDYLRDRARYVNALLEANSANTNHASSFDQNTWTINDQVTGRVLTLAALGAAGVDANGNVTGGSGDAAQFNQLVFGSNLNGANVLGAAGDDHLYAGTGTTLLNGAGGDDYLEAGSGDATLIGGSGRDTLIGGAGNDVFRFASGDGNDMLVDGKGIGSIVIDGVTLTGGRATSIGGKVWQSADGKVTYTLLNAANGSRNLQIRYGQAAQRDSVTVNNFVDGALGITLTALAATALVDPDTSVTPTGVPFNAGQADAYTRYFLSNANSLVQAGSTPIRVFGWDGTTTVQATGNNLIDGSSGNDTVESGSGNSVIAGGGGRDVMIAGDGANRIYANGESNLDTAIGTANAGAGTAALGSLFAVGNGNNTIVGGSARDLIMTGSGDNTIVLGHGDSIVVGGVGGFSIDSDTSHLQWGVERIGSGKFDVSVNANAGAYASIAVDGQGPVPAPGYDGNYFSAGGNGGARHALGNGNDTIYGGSGNSLIVLSNGDNYVDTGSGNSTVLAGTGNNTIFGGSGNAAVRGSSGDDYIDGEGGDDYLVGRGGNNTIIGGSGHDTLYAGDDSANWASSVSGNNYLEAGDDGSNLYGASGNDTLVGGAGNDVLNAGSGNQTLYGGGGSDQLWGGAGTNVLYAGDGGTAAAPTQVVAGSGATTIVGGAGIDRLFGGTGDNLIVAGDGGDALNPTLVIAGSGRTTLIGGSGVAVLNAQAASVASIQGGAGNATLLGGAGDDTLIAGSGNEFIDGGGGHDTYVFGIGDGRDTVVASASDTLRFDAGITAADVALSVGRGSDGADVLVADYGSGSIAVVGGLAGNASYQFADGAALTLAQLTAASRGLEIVGDADGLVLSAALGGDSTITGGAGQDSIVGGAGNDVLTAGSGDSLLTGGGGNNILNGGSGNSRLYAVSDGDDWSTSSGGNNLLRAGSGNDQLFGSAGDDTLIAGSGSDVLNAGSGHQTLYSGSGSARLDATRAAVALLYGGSGPTTMLGGAGNDTLVAGSGNDYLDGGAGTNVYRFNAGFGNDTITAGAGIDHLEFGAGLTPADLTLSIARINSKAALVIDAGNGNRLTIQDGLSGSVSQIAFADGSVLSLQQLIAQARNVPVNRSGDADGVLIDGGFGNDSIIGGNGNDVIDGWAGNDTLIAGSGNDVIYGGSGDSVLVATSGSDRLIAGDGNNTLVAGVGYSVLNAGSGNNNFILSELGTTEISASLSANSGIQTVWLPEGMRISDFTSVRDGQDLILQSSTGDSAAFIRNFYDPATTDKWLVIGDQDAPQLLSGSALSDSTPITAAGRVDAARVAFQIGLKADLLARGQTGESLGSLQNLSGGRRYLDAASGRYAEVVYRFDGVTTENFVAANGALVLSNSEKERVTLENTTTTYDEVIKNFSTVQSASHVYTVQVPVGIDLLDFGTHIPHGASVEALDNRTYLVDVPGIFRRVRQPDTVITKTVTGFSSQVIRDFTIENVTLPAASATRVTVDHSSNPFGSGFRGTVTTGQLDAYVNLGTTSARNADWFTLPADHFATHAPSYQPFGLGAFVQAGAGNDTLIGTDGNDVLVGGSGFNFADGGRGADTYYATLTGDSVDLIVDSGDPGNAYQIETGAVYGGVFPVDTLVLPQGVTLKNLRWRVIDDAQYPDRKVLQLKYGDANVLVVFAEPFSREQLHNHVAAASNGDQIAPGIERFQFADGSVVTRAQLMEQAPQLGAEKPPVLTAIEQTARRGVGVEASQLFQVSDLVHDPISWLRIENHGSGYFEQAGVSTEATELLVRSADLSQLKYVGNVEGADSTLRISAFDGVSWTAPVTAVVHTSPPNPVQVYAYSSAPIVVNPEQNESLATHFGITSTGGAITQVQFKDTTAGAGVLQFHGEQVDQITVDFNDYANVQYHAGGSADHDAIQVRAFNGTDWSDWLTLQLQTPVAPVIVATANRTLAAFESVAISSYFNATDADNKPVTAYQFQLDGSGDGVLISSDGIPNPYTVDAAKLNTIRLVAGFPGDELQLLIRGFDGNVWGAWTTINISVPASANAFRADDINQIINGTANADTLVGGYSNDTLAGGAGADTYLFSSVSDAPDTIVDSGGDNTLQLLYQTPDAVSIDTVLGQVRVFNSGETYVTNLRLPAGVSGTLADVIHNFRFADGTVLTYDQIAHSGNGIVVSGSAGNRTFTGTSGHDVFSFNAGDGNARIFATGTDNTLQFGAGITPAMLTLGLGSLLLRVGSGGDQIHIEGFDPAHAENGSAIQRLRFTDGTELSLTQLLARGFDINGSAGDDILIGTDLDNRIDGGVGNDALFATPPTTPVADNATGNADLIVNGSFETNPVAAGNYGLIANGSLSGWRNDAGGVVEIWNSFSLGRASDGASLAELDAAGAVDTLAQTVHTVAGQIYTLDFDLAQRGGVTDGSAEVYWNGQRIGTGLATSTNWLTNRLQVIGTGGNDELLFKELAAENNGVGPLLDNVRLKPLDTNNLILNGSFELNSVATGNYGLIANGNLAGWTNAAGGVVEVWNQFSLGQASDGKALVELDAANAIDTLAQRVQTVAGQTYSLQFDLARRVGVADASAEVYWNGQRIGTGVAASSNWSTINFSVTGTGGNDELLFKELAAENNGVGPLIDNVRLALVNRGDTLTGGAGRDILIGSGADDVLIADDLSVEDLIANGSFEINPVAAGNYGLIANGNLPGWRNDAGGVVEVWNQFSLAQASDGKALAELDAAGAVDSLSQHVQTNAGQSYTLQFDLARRNGVADSSAEVYWNGQRIGTGVASGTNWSTISFTVTGTGGNDELLFKELASENNGVGPLLDNVRLLPATSASVAANLLYSGAGNDTLTGGRGNDLLIGGIGNDTLTTGSGADVIGFNAGDGQDWISSSIGSDNTLSLGKGIRYADLLFSKNADDLLLSAGGSDQIRLKDWYTSPGNHSIANLQIVIEDNSDYNATSASVINNKKIEQFNFDGLVNQFDQARIANPALNSWALSSALLNFHLGGSDSAAIGGDLAYQYARNGNLSTISVNPAQGLLASAQFGSAAQGLQPAASLQDLSPRLG